MNDKDKRDAAVDAFAQKMKDRLDEKAAEGFRGWDIPHWSIPLKKSMTDKAIRVERYNHQYKNDVVDIANFAMIIDYGK